METMTMGLSAKQEIRIRLIEAITPVLAARATTSVPVDTTKWAAGMTGAMEQMFKAAEHLVLPTRD